MLAPVARMAVARLVSARRPTRMVIRVVPFDSSRAPPLGTRVIRTLCPHITPSQEGHKVRNTSDTRVAEWAGASAAFRGVLRRNAERPHPDERVGPSVRCLAGQTQIALTSSGMPGPNVVETAPFWM